MELLVRAARIQLGLDAETAVKTTELALEIRDDDGDALAIAERALESLGWHDQLIKVLERRAEVVGHLVRDRRLRRRRPLGVVALARAQRPRDVEAVRPRVVELIELHEPLRRRARAAGDDRRRVARRQIADGRPRLLGEFGVGGVFDDRRQRAVVVEEERDLLAEPRNYFGAALEGVRQRGGRRRLDGVRARRA